MSVYSEMLPDSQILEGVEGMKKVVVVGCTGCANASLAVTKKMPLSRIEVNTETGEKTLLPEPMMAETNRLKNLLEQKGITVEIELLAGSALCARFPETETVEAEFVRRCAGVEAAVGVVCDAGLPGLKEHFGDTVKIVPAMKVMGTQHRYVVLDDSKEFLYQDEKRSKQFNLHKAQKTLQ